MKTSYIALKCMLHDSPQQVVGDSARGQDHGNGCRVFYLVIKDSQKYFSVGKTLTDSLLTEWKWFCQ